MYVERQERFETLTRFIAQEMRSILSEYPEYNRLTILVMPDRDGYMDVTMGSDERLVGFSGFADGEDNIDYYRETSIDLTKDDDYEAEKEDALSIAAEEGIA